MASISDALDSLTDAFQNLADQVTSLIQNALSALVSMVETTVDTLTDSLNHLGVLQSEKVPLSCGGHVQIEYYVRSPT